MKHPAKFSSPLLPLLAGQVKGCTRLLDPFAGVGRVHELGVPSWGVEIEPEWATEHPRTVVGNALALPFRAHAFDGVATSPTYGNRMADHHNAKDTSVRNTYRHVLGRPLHNDNSGKLQWGSEYRAFHRAAWDEVDRVLEPGGLFVLNISDHIRKGSVQPVSDWHVGFVTRVLFFKLVAEVAVPTQRQRQGANGELRVDHEHLYVFRKRECGTTRT